MSDTYSASIPIPLTGRILGGLEKLPQAIARLFSPRSQDAASTVPEAPQPPKSKYAVFSPKEIAELRAIGDAYRRDKVREEIGRFHYGPNESDRHLYLRGYLLQEHQQNEP